MKTIACLAVGAIVLLPVLPGVAAVMKIESGMTMQFFSSERNNVLGGTGVVGCYYDSSRSNASMTRWRMEATLMTTGERRGRKPNSIIDGFMIRALTFASPDYFPPKADINYNPRWAQHGGGSTLSLVGWDSMNAGTAGFFATGSKVRLVFDDKGRLIRKEERAAQPFSEAPKFQLRSAGAFTASGTRQIYFYDIMGMDFNGNYIYGNKSPYAIINCGSSYRPNR